MLNQTTQASEAEQTAMLALEREAASEVGIEDYDPDAPIGELGEESNDAIQEQSSETTSDPDAAVQESSSETETVEESKAGPETSSDSEESQAVTISQADHDAALAKITANFEARTEQMKTDQDTHLKRRLEEEKAVVETAAQKVAWNDLSDEAKGRALLEESNQEVMLAELLPKAEEQALDNLQRTIGPQIIPVMGLSDDIQEWPKSILDAYQKEAPEGMVAHIKFLHEQTLAVRETELGVEHAQALKDLETKLRTEFGTSMKASGNAINRNSESSNSIQSTTAGQGVSGDLEELERKYVDGLATPQERLEYEKIFQGDASLLLKGF